MEQPSPSKNNLSQSAYALAAGMLWQDRWRAIALFALLLLPLLIETLQVNVTMDGAFFTLLLQRFVQLLFLYLISVGWLRKLSMKGFNLSGAATLRFFAVGYAIWLALISPLIVQFLDVDDGLKLISMISLIPLFILWLRYYFYFISLALGLSNYKEIMSFAGSLISNDRKIPFYTLLSPLGIVALLCGLIYLPAPDGRIAGLFFLASVAAELLWPLCCYLSLAFAFTLIPDQEWRRFELDPYRDGRFETLRLSAPRLLTNLFKARTGAKLLLAGVLIWIVNRVQLESLPPAPAISVTSTKVDGDKVSVTLDLKDEKYNFRGFQPVNFVLAGEERHPVSEEIQDLQSSAGGKELLFQIPPDLTATTITIIFKANRSGDALKSLEDLYLWYRLTKVSKLSLK